MPTAVARKAAAAAATSGESRQQVPSQALAPFALAVLRVPVLEPGPRGLPQVRRHDLQVRLLDTEPLSRRPLAAAAPAA